MTIIVYRDGIMAGDTASWSREIIVGHHKKVHRTSDGWLFGCSGAVDEIQPVEEWMMSGQKGAPPRCKETTVLRVSPDGAISLLTSRSRGFFRVDAPWTSIGYGTEFATGCMASGMSAVETAKLALKHVPFLGGKITSERLLSCTTKRKSILRTRKGR